VITAGAHIGEYNLRYLLADRVSLIQPVPFHRGSVLKFRRIPYFLCRAGEGLCYRLFTLTMACPDSFSSAVHGVIKSFQNPPHRYLFCFAELAMKTRQQP
jgi:hypothetical protein